MNFPWEQGKIRQNRSDPISFWKEIAGKSINVSKGFPGGRYGSFNFKLIYSAIMRIILKTISVLFIFQLVLVADAPSSGHLTISYLERPPYYYTVDNQALGFLVDLTKLLLEEAGIAYVMVPLPPKRIFREIQEPGRDHCSIGWFKSSERLKFAKFSLPFYQDKSQVILTLLDNKERIAKHQTLKSLFEDKTLLMGKVATFSYGDYVDSLIELYEPVTFEVTSTQKQLVQLVHLNRISYMIISPEEVDTLINMAGLNRHDFFLHSIPSIPEGNKRYLMCSYSVKDVTIERINAEIRKHVASTVWNE